MLFSIHIVKLWYISILFNFYISFTRLKTFFITGNINLMWKKVGDLWTNYEWLQRCVSTLCPRWRMLRCPLTRCTKASISTAAYPGTCNKQSHNIRFSFGINRVHTYIYENNECNHLFEKSLRYEQFDFLPPPPFPFCWNNYEGMIYL